jgi:hypothetical protein
VQPRLTPHVQRLLSVAPGSPEAEAEQHAIESLFQAVLHQGGRPAGEALVQSLAADGYVLERLDALPCMWRVGIPSPRVLELWFTGGDDPVIGSLSYRVGKPWGSSRQRAAARLQAAFYSRYEALASSRATRLAQDDRLIVLIADLEADLNNGGFQQYLENKGVATARKTLAALTAVGAKRTAGWLRAALKSAGRREALDRLDSAFYERPEDLASIVMRDCSRRMKLRRRRRTSG